jgi:hypothetical protein
MRKVYIIVCWENISKINFVYFKGYVLNMLKKEIKNKSNNDMIIFYTFKTMNAQFSKKNFHNNLLN